jgi:hypothetical protein
LAGILNFPEISLSAQIGSKKLLILLLVTGLAITTCVGLSITTCVGLAITTCVGLAIATCVGLAITTCVGLARTVGGISAYVYILRINRTWENSTFSEFNIRGDFEALEELYSNTPFILKNERVES